jgi:ribosome-binding factor A
MKKRTTARDYPRTARLNTLVREILGEELERIDDERLEFVVITQVVVDGDLGRAVAYYDHSRGDDAEEEITKAFAERRPRLQSAVGRQARIKRTPELRFEPDVVLRNAERIEQVLRGLQDDPPVPDLEPEPGTAAGPVDVPDAPDGDPGGEPA